MYVQSHLPLALQSPPNAILTLKVPTLTISVAYERIGMIEVVFMQVVWEDEPAMKRPFGRSPKLQQPYITLLYLYQLFNVST